MRTQFAAEQFGIRSCNDQTDILPQQPVDEQEPLLDVLYFVQKEIAEIHVNHV